MLYPQEDLNMVSYDRVIFRVELIFLAIFAGTMFAMDHGMSQIEILVSNALSAIMIAWLLSRMIYCERKELIKQFDRQPWLSGFLCAGASIVVVMTTAPSYYVHFIDYTLAIIVIPVGILLAAITAWGRAEYIGKKQKIKVDGA